MQTKTKLQPLQINPDQLVLILEARAMIARKRSELKDLEKGLENLETVVQKQLKDDFLTPDGWRVEILKTRGQCRPAWKDLYLTHMETVHGVSEESCEAGARANTAVGSSEELQIVPPSAPIRVLS